MEENISISAVGKYKRGNSFLATKNRQKRLSEASAFITNKKYLNHNKRIYGESILTNLFNEGFAMERIMQGREIKIGEYN